ncbi:MAG TPA: CGNR zinc finger domain-containing protein [Candidatus Binatia bacterium]|nr:CGNR zinc finger domain-containing protein [Candidatus Binatia bacterium]
MEQVTITAKQPAPGRLSEVQDFLNTRDVEEGTDDLGTEASAVAWLRARGLRLTRFAEADRRRLVEVREALRELLQGHHRDGAPAGAEPRLDALFAGVRLRPRLSTDGATLAPQAGGAEGYLGMLSIAIVEATLAGTWQRLKVCRQSSCRWAFYDHTKNGRGSWCSMRVCGSRAKARAYRARQAASRGAGSSG